MHLWLRYLRGTNHLAVALSGFSERTLDFGNSMATPTEALAASVAKDHPLVADRKRCHAAEPLPAPRPGATPRAAAAERGAEGQGRGGGVDFPVECAVGELRVDRARLLFVV